MPSEHPTMHNLQVARPVQHPMQEILYRSRDPRLLADTVARVVMKGWDLISPADFSVLYRRVRCHTMCSNARLRALYHGVRYIVSSNLTGDVVECGCARGGSAALMALALRQLSARRRIWLFDTFAGLPAPTHEDPDYHIADLYTGSCLGTVAEVRRFFEDLDVADDVLFIKGLFQDTLPVSGVSQIALLHVDGDWYESVKTCLEQLYDKVIPGGIIQFDDYGYWKGARKAVDEFLRTRGIGVPLRRLDYSGRSLLKPPSRTVPRQQSA